MLSNARSINGILKARGVRTPPLDKIEAYARGLTPEQDAEVKERLWRIERGTEHPDDIPALLEAIRGTPDKAAAHLASEAPVPEKGAQTPASGRATRRPAAPAAPEAATTGERADLAWLRSHGAHVWASSAALKFELTPLRRGEDEDAPQQYTVQIEGAKKREGRADWEHKVIFQLTLRELPLFAAFLLGYAGQKMSLHNHGPNADKSLSLEDQGNRFFCRLAEAGSIVPVPIDPLDAFRCAEIALAALHLNRPTCPPEMQLALLRRLGAMHQAGGGR